MSLKILLPAALLLTFATHAEAAKVDCRTMEAALSAAEDSAEFALAGDAQSLASGVKKLRTSLRKLKPALSTAAFNEAMASLDKFDAAVKASQNEGAALAALDVYRAIAADIGKYLPSGEHVAMLDYAGFRISALLSSAQTDWTALALETQDANTHWSAVKPQVDAAIADLFGEILQGLAAAALARYGYWLQNLARVELAAVDLLERNVKNSAKGACK